MIRKKILILFTILSVLALGACGSSSSGGGGGGGGGGLGTGGFTKTIAPDGADAFYGSLFDTSGGARYQILYRAQDINASGMINAISLRYDTTLASAVSCPNVTIKLGHTSLPALSTTYGLNVEEGKGTNETVLNNATVNIPAGTAGNYFSIPLTQFNYNGVDNLVVEVIRTAACSANVEIDAGEFAAIYAGLNFSTDPAATDGSIAFQWLAFAKFNFAGGDDRTTIDGASAGFFFPFSTTATDQKVQLLYDASEINGSGPITGISFKVGALTTAQTYTLNVKMGHTALGALIDGSTFANNFSAAPTTVATGVTFTVPAGVPVGDYVWLPLTGSFNYNGTDNLIVEIEATSASGTFVTASANLTGRRLSAAVGSPIADGTGGNDAFYIAKFRFNGGTMDVIVSTINIGQAFPFWNISGSIQHLYHASQLGTAGSITGFECRNNAAPAAQTGLNYTITLAHSTAMDLGTNFAANLQADAVQVYNGTFDIPLTIVGDWFGIDFTTPFNYNGTSNLVMEIRGTGGTADQFSCKRSSGMPNNQLNWGGTDAAATNGTTSAALIDTRFRITK